MPKTSCILAIWSTSLEPGNNGCKLQKEEEDKLDYSSVDVVMAYVDCLCRLCDKDGLSDKRLWYGLCDMDE